VSAPGDEPRRILAYRLAAPPRPFTLLTQAGMARVRGVLQAEEEYGPPLAVHFEPETSAFRFGVSRITWRIAAASTADDPKVAAHTKLATERAAQRLVGSRFTVFVGPHGESAVETPTATDLLEQRLLDEIERVFAVELAPPLPREPVGRGAHWTAHRVRALGLAMQVDYAIELTLDDLDTDGFDLGVMTTFAADPQPPPPTPGLEANVVVDQVEGTLAGRVVRLTGEATPVYSDLDLEAVMSLTEMPIEPGDEEREPTDEERRRGYRLVVRSREVMQADALGPLDWEHLEDAK